MKTPIRSARALAFFVWGWESNYELLIILLGRVISPALALRAAVEMLGCDSYAILV